MDANTQIAHRLKSLREQKGLDQLELAEKMGYKSQSTISKWERGVNLPNGGKLVKLALILGTTTDYILFGEEIENTPEPEKPVIEITRIADFAMMLDGKPLTDEEKDKFESLVKLYFGDKYGEDK
ncbi:transcriptional regulator [Streptococcus uberis]|uniref:helix-turn-helix domain-containing protein n=1 Tax=Streptococcus uberis TaxID=1349 RepID=UPI000C2D0207|nr:helix-turn-helix transcriptional regulator [Streptococcus uberis]AUC25589.1 transcriptional regulator [Streptococcus uberis]